MRKVKHILIAIMLLIPCMAMASDIEFTVNTSQGEIRCVLPDGYSWEDYAKEMSVLYLEERFANDKLIEQTEALLEASDKHDKELVKLKESYEATLESKDNLIAKMKEKDALNTKLLAEKDELLALEKERNKTPIIRGILGVGASMTDALTMGFSLQGGIILWDNVALQFGINMFPLDFSLMASFLF